jgi:hypothetical protein
MAGIRRHVLGRYVQVQLAASESVLSPGHDG